MSESNSKPDFLDMDDDGDTDEPMRDAAKEEAAQDFKNRKMNEVMRGKSDG